MDSGEALNWREAIDPNTGAVYYYHRKTRETTWIRPACLDSPLPPVSPSEPNTISQQPVLKFRGGPPAEEDYEEGDNTEDDEFGESVQDDNNFAQESYTDRTQPSDGYIVDSEEEFLYILSLCQSTDPDVLLGQDPSLIDHLVNAAALWQPPSLHSASPLSSLSTRQVAIHALYLLSLGNSSPSIHFHKNQSWAQISSFVTKWGNEGDFYSSISYIAMLSLLLGSSARGVIGDTTVKQLSQWLHGLLTGGAQVVTFGLWGPNSESRGSGSSAVWDSILTPPVLQSLSRCTGGHSLSGLLLCFLAQQTLPSDGTKFVACGGLAALLTLAQRNEYAQTDVQPYVHALLESMMERSGYVRMVVLKGFMALSGAVGALAIPSGADPLVMGGDEHEEFDPSSDPLTERLHQESISLPRDVDWIPTAGTSWKVASTLLWSRCPGLRETIEGLWEQPGGELELGTRTSSPALASAVRYLHTGILVPPCTTHGRIDLLKLATELGCAALVETSEHAVLMGLEREDLEDVQEIVAGLGLDTLTRRLKEYAATGVRPSIDDTSDLIPIHKALISTTNPNPSSRRKANTSSLDLHEAVTRSVLEVSSTVRSVAHTPRTAPHTGNPHTGTPHTGNPHTGTPHTSSTPSSMDDTEVQFTSHSPSFPSFSTAYTPNLHTGVSSSHSGTARRSAQNGAAGKVQSGGIYGLLLTEENMTSMGGMDVGRAGGKVPGKLPKEPGPKAAFGSTANAKKVGQGAKRPTRPTAASTDASLGLGVYEYETAMSLIKNKEPSKREKRLQTLALPRSSPPREKSGGGSGTVSGTGSGSGGNVSSPHRSTSPLLNSSEKPSARLNLFSSIDETGGVGMGMGMGSGSTMVETALDPSVRSSLVLLKAKSAGVGRRRRSIDTVSTDAAPVVETRDDETLHQPSARTPLPTKNPNPTTSLRTRTINRASAGCTKKQGCVCPECQTSASVSVDNGWGMGGTGMGGIGSTSGHTGTPKIDSYGESYASTYIVLDADATDEPEYQPHSTYPAPNSLSAASQPQFEASSPVPLSPCPHCSRNFTHAALAKHAPVCTKVFSKKSTSTATASSSSGSSRWDDAPEHSTTTGRGNGGSSNHTAPSWKEKSQQFRDAMKGARAYSTALAKGGPLPEYVPTAPDPSFIPCPHCGRRFNQKAGERHIPQCRDIKARPTSLKAHSR